MRPRKILFVASEAHPLMKTGGLGDVAGALPAALQALHQDVRLVMPAYRAAMRRAGNIRIASLALEEDPHPVRILETTLPGSEVTVWLVDSAPHFDRNGNPYTGPDGHDWPDNPERFSVFARAVTALALDQAGLAWRPDVVHCNDWQSGLVPALLHGLPGRPATVFTIHNLAYQGIFAAEHFWRQKLPGHLWSPEGVEFYGNLSFIKGGLVYADRLNTVSPTYAREITTPEFGCNLDGLLRARADRLCGILNGADYSVWDPVHDPYLSHHYSAGNLDGKAANKAALQRETGLPVSAETPVIGLVGRLAAQKGVDLVLSALPALLSRPVQTVLLGSGDAQLEQTLKTLAEQYPDRLHVTIGFSEEFAHRIEAGADLFLMPSRYEPCGLNQIYSLRYGTLPVVRRTGGLADTVVDASDGPRRATGFVFSDPSPEALLEALSRALALYRRPRAWRRLQRNAMAQDFSWANSARNYLKLYERSLSQKPAPPEPV
ncbi:MAG TPA: glycogen synthase GlgA [Gammaproteobacteria bacterium]|nr:glycogen synthase GlgA [Gammaproteobacteria bacterium]